MKGPTLGIYPEARRQAGKRSSWISGDHINSVLSKWHAAVLVGLLRDEREPVEWDGLHVGAEKGVVAYASVTDEYSTVTLGMARRSSG